MTYPTAATRRPQIEAAIAEVIQLLTPNVVHIRYDIDQDWTGDWSIFFRVLLSDEAARNRSKAVATEVVWRLSERLDFSSLGVFPYHNFRSASEQAVLMEPVWV